MSCARSFDSPLSWQMVTDAPTTASRFLVSFSKRQFTSRDSDLMWQLLMALVVLTTVVPSLLIAYRPSPTVSEFGCLGLRGGGAAVRGAAGGGYVCWPCAY